jgi:hypothetical protein
LQGPLKFTQIGIFGLKIYHLATLDWTGLVRGKLSLAFCCPRASIIVGLDLDLLEESCGLFLLRLHYQYCDTKTPFFGKLFAAIFFQGVICKRHICVKIEPVYWRQ